MWFLWICDPLELGITWIQMAVIENWSSWKGKRWEYFFGIEWLHWHMNKMNPKTVMNAEYNECKCYLNIIIILNVCLRICVFLNILLSIWNTFFLLLDLMSRFSCIAPYGLPGLGLPRLHTLGKFVRYVYFKIIFNVAIIKYLFSYLSFNGRYFPNLWFS